MKIEARGLCCACYKHRAIPGYMPGEKRQKLDRSMREKLAEEWPHFKSILGWEMAIHRLAQAFHRSPVTIQNWVEENDPVWAVAA
ncbi:hypothetical protein [Corynebacterium mastitidis]|uniref:hypothetical protein n=1 Tax=Corynebacterium mastitidis TaxID=161890 RepID=UPI00254BD409|nr:hypothetical protein [Corynebacterium mastitidis]MDK8450966.1 hypothetical protein [Corynebacterium mastitidis]